MIRLPGWLARPPILAAEPPKGPQGPWGGGGGGDQEPGPRNPWSVPPSGRKGAAKPTALDEFLARAKRVGGGGGGGGGGMPQLPAGNARTLWAIGVGVLVLVWIVFTSFHQIGPQQRGIVSYFGRYSETLSPGIRLTLPAPIVSVQKVDVEQVRTDDFPRDGTENLALTGDQNIIALAYSVRWNIQNPRDFAFQLSEPGQTVRDAAESAMRAVLATTTLSQAIGAGRTTIEAKVQQLMQQMLDDYQSGVRVQGVSIKQATAPAALIDDFNAVTAAQQEAQGNLNNARSYAQQVIAKAQGEATAFDKQYEQYRLSPEVTRRRMYYETMEAVMAKADKTIVEPNGVAPYLALPPGRRAAEPEVTTTPQPAQPQPQAGGGR